ncbi:hypothetical protein LUX33_11915 [Actinomadura madurae]|uniref:hypothetical protein n=1 Tax=Actinomadura madurae TaxID=1993 RepID=UPI0020D24501|nr:hypothetical protein [Actinomadura madurae]MCP9949049.1 hypothetical protein [Actinomadura madurae]
MRRLRGVSIGSASAWLPSRRSTGTHSGALSMRRDGQVRSIRGTGDGTRSCTDRYRWNGIELPRCGFQKGAPSATGPDGVRKVEKFMGLCPSHRRTTGSTGPRGGVPVRIRPRRGDREEEPATTWRPANHTSAPQTS